MNSFSSVRLTIILSLGIILAACDGWGTRAPTPVPPSGFFKVDTLGSGETFGYPSISADGQLLAIATGKDKMPQAGQLAELFVVNLESNEIIHHLSKGISDSIALSPNGTNLATGDGYGQTVIINLEDNSSYKLTPGSYPTWSPDGKIVAVSTANLDEKNQLLALDLRLVDVLQGSESIVFETQSELGGYITDIIWSPNQDKLVFVMETEGQTGQGELYLLDITNGELKQLTDGWLVWSPNFSPDGKRILFVGNLEPYEIGTRYEIFVIDFDGNCHLIDSPVPRLEGVVISQGGERVVFDTYYGVLAAEPEIAMGENFWRVGTQC